MPKLVNGPRGSKRPMPLDAAEEFLQQLEAQRPNDEAWSPRRAFDAQMIYLAALEGCTVATFAEQGDARVLAEQGHAEHAARRLVALRRWRDRVGPVTIYAALAALEAADLTRSRARQDVAIAALFHSAREIRWRVAMIRPDLERSLRLCPLPWDRHAGFGEAMLPWFEVARTNPIGRLKLATPGAVHPDVFDELNGHFALLAGDPVVPPLSRSLQLVHDCLSSAAARWELVGTVSPPTRVRSPWEQLLDLLDELHKERHPLAPLLGFVEAVRLFGLSTTRMWQRSAPGSGASTIVVPRLPLLAAETLASARRGDGARNHAERAVQTLGWRAADLSNAERARTKRLRRKRSR